MEIDCLDHFDRQRRWKGRGLGTVAAEPRIALWYLSLIDTICLNDLEAVMTQAKDKPAKDKPAKDKPAKDKPTLARPATAKLFMHGRSQAVRLPKEFRFEGKEVRVSRVGEKVILEPLELPPFDYEAWRAQLDAFGASDFLPDGLPDDPPVEPEDFDID